MTQNNFANNGTPDNAAFKVGGQSPITFDRFIRGLIGLLLIAGLGTALYYFSACFGAFLLDFSPLLLTANLLTYFAFTSKQRLPKSISLFLILHFLCKKPYISLTIVSIHDI